LRGDLLEALAPWPFSSGEEEISLRDAVISKREMEEG
jgi:hypothetical protein